MIAQATVGREEGARCLGICTHLGRPAVRYELVPGTWSFSLSDGAVSVIARQ